MFNLRLSLCETFFNRFMHVLFIRCMIRVLDSFGTFPEYNYPAYPHAIPGNRSDWANHNLIPTQFLTLYRKYSFMDLSCIKIF